MCDPMTAMIVASTAISATQAIGGHQQQKAASKAAQQSAAIEFNETKDALAERQAQEQAATSQKIFNNTREAVQAKATQQATSSALGTEGLSVDALVSDIARQETENNSIITNNHNATLNQLSREENSASIRASNQANSVSGPSALNTILQLGQAGISGYDKYQTSKKAK